jgi:hypothetical protein
MTNWPSKIPLLLSAFRVVDNGVLVQRNTTVGGRSRVAGRWGYCR